MRRWLAILLVFFVSAQSSWAAVAEQHAHRPLTIGHPEHTAHGGVPTQAVPGSKANDASAAAAPSAHLDCDHCHGHCTGLLDAPPPLNAASPPGIRPVARGDATASERDPTRPDRPQWLRLA
jgi:hypothetical protein